MEITFNIPLGIDIEFNEACNASCVFCPVNINPRRKNKHMSLEDSDIVFKKLKKQTLEHISFSVFNETLLDPLFFQRIEQLRKYKLYKKANDKKTQPMMINIILCVIHNGQGSKLY